MHSFSLTLLAHVRKKQHCVGRTLGMVCPTDRTETTDSCRRVSGSAGHPLRVFEGGCD